VKTQSTFQESTESQAFEQEREFRAWNAFISLYSREMKRFLKVVFQTVFTPMINSTLYLLIFGVSLGSNIHLENGVSYLSFLIPGLVMMGVLNNAFQNSSSSIVAGRFSGDLEDLKVVPLTPSVILWAMAIGGLSRGLLVGLITYSVGAVFQFATTGEVGTVAHPASLLFFLSMGGLIFAMIGIAVGFMAKSFDQMSAIGSFVLLPLIYLGGVFFSTRGLNPFWQAVANFNPVLYLINGVRYGALGVSDVDVNLAAAVSGVAFVVCYVLALRFLRIGNYGRW
jgi:ABC-2 type transport system permease protein